MHAVGVVPHEHEVLRRRLHIGNAVNRLVGVDNAVGLEYFGTHHMPLTAGSFTSCSTRSMSGPVGVMGTVIISKPNDW